jgi:hypothetical protein
MGWIMSLAEAISLESNNTSGQGDNLNTKLTMSTKQTATKKCFNMQVAEKAFPKVCNKQTYVRQDWTAAMMVDLIELLFIHRGAECWQLR